MAKETGDSRPDPDLLLEKIQKEQQGQLTVFLGAAAGVGKTYKMLQSAHDRLAEGVDIAIGWIESHGRMETEKLVTGLPRIAPKTITYRNKNLQEMDVDAILKQKPALVLVDELAHTNVAGSRHTRRFQDVEELLKAGINIYTTVNIQHIESLNDVVAQITGVIVRETVPDLIIEEANHILLIDIPPEELIKRLKEGKIYVPGQAEQALKNFFRPGNINALRELALRFTANRVDQEMTEYMHSHQIAGPWPTAGRVLVCIGASPFSAQVIRAARQLAGGLHAELFAIHVETTFRPFPMGDKERERLSRNLKLVEELGGKTLTAIGDNPAREILSIARKYNVTAIVIGKSRHKRRREFWRGSIVNILIRDSGGMNVYVIQGEAEKEQEPRSRIRTVFPAPRALPWLHFVGGLAFAALITLICWTIRPYLEMVNIALLYLLPVLFTAVWWGRWPSYATALSCVLAFDFLFVPPVMKLSTYDIRYIWSFVTFLLVSFVIGGRTERLRLDAKSSRQREESIRSLYKFSRDIAAVIDPTLVAKELAVHAGEMIGRDTFVLLPDQNNRLILLAAYQANGATPAKTAMLPEAEYAVAVWTFQNGRSAGRSTETLPGAQNLYIPLIAGDLTDGVFCINTDKQQLTPEESRLINAWAGLAAIAIERINLAEQARQAHLAIESERLRLALVNSVSHELRTPLATITGSVSTLLDPAISYSSKDRHMLLETIYDGSIRMEHVITNLLDTARQESGMLRLKADWCDIVDIIGAALRRIASSSKNHVIETDLPVQLPLFRADCVLLEQVLVNIIDNAVKYSPVGRVITLSAAHTSDSLNLSIADSGPGIPEQDLARIFEKFYRSPQTKQIAGTGLGLSICKGIIEAHQGRIWAENQAGSGARINFTIPLTNDRQRAFLSEAGE